jgi:hypothetical protein
MTSLSEPHNQSSAPAGLFVTVNRLNNSPKNNPSSCLMFDGRKYQAVVVAIATKEAGWTAESVGSHAIIAESGRCKRQIEI